MVNYRLFLHPVKMAFCLWFPCKYWCKPSICSQELYRDGKWRRDWMEKECLFRFCLNEPESDGLAGCNGCLQAVRTDMLSVKAPCRCRVVWRQQIACSLCCCRGSNKHKHMLFAFFWHMNAACTHRCSASLHLPVHTPLELSRNLSTDQVSKGRMLRSIG